MAPNQNSGWKGFAIVDHESCFKAWSRATHAENEKAKKVLMELAEDLHLSKILQRRHWRVEVLRELNEHESKSHCGHNAGKGAREIAIQLRNGHVFFDAHQIMGIMLHELSHNEFSNHGPKFKVHLHDRNPYVICTHSHLQALEADLWKEYNSYANPFEEAGPGRRVGGTERRLIPLKAYCSKGVFGGTGYRVGGPPVAEASAAQPGQAQAARRLPEARGGEQGMAMM